LVTQAQALLPRARLSTLPDGRQHARRLLGLPQHLEQDDLVGLAANRRDVDLASRRLPLGRHLLHGGERRDDLLRFGLARHAVGRVNRGAEDVALLLDDGAEMAADADRDMAVVVIELAVDRDALLHAFAGVHRVIGGRKGRHDLVAHRLDDGAAVALCRLAHDVEATAHHLPRFDVAELFV
jgi:hypothetical protein